MGTFEKKLWIPTDANVIVKHNFYKDLEDADQEDRYREVLSAAREYEPSGREKDDAESHVLEWVRSAVSDEFSNIYLDDTDSHEVSIEWHRRTLDVCEWCESPNCDGDPSECEDAPSPCDYCGEMEDSCECVFCEFCGEYVAEDDMRECAAAVIEREKVKAYDKPMIFIHDLPVNEDEPDVESLL
jgi:hypothetical protein